MTNPHVAIEYVALVRRVLAAGEHPDVARVGALGEITYLVDELIEQAEVEVLDALIASVSGEQRRGSAGRLQELRNSLQPYVGKHLLKTGMQCASRRYEIYVDPIAETIVHLTGFYLHVPPGEPEDAPPADRARWIFAHPRDGSRDDGRRVVELLLAGRDVAALSSEELLLLAKGYNWWGQNAKAFETAKIGLRRSPHSAEWLSHAQLYVRNAFLNDLPRMLTACDGCITAGVGPAAFWHLLKADQILEVATGECELEDYEWSPGHPILHPELLRPAAEALEAALACQPELREQEAAGDWNLRFAALWQDPAFRHLAR